MNMLINKDALLSTLDKARKRNDYEKELPTDTRAKGKT